MMWRTLKKLSKGFDTVVPEGSITALEWIDDDGLERLQRVGAIARLTAPPLRKLPGWELRSERLKEVGITTAEQFLETDDKELAGKIGADPRTVARWRDELLNRWLAVPKVRRR